MCPVKQLRPAIISDALRGFDDHDARGYRRTLIEKFPQPSVHLVNLKHQLISQLEDRLLSLGALISRNENGTEILLSGL